MKFSTKGRYALRIMADLAYNDTGEYIPLKEIAARQDITVKYLEQIIPLLSRAGYVNSVRGNSGGYRLAKTPQEYTVGDILRATEGSLAPIVCLENPANQCERQSQCETLFIWEGLYKLVNEYFDSITLQDILNRKKSLHDPQDYLFMI